MAAFPCGGDDRRPVSRKGQVSGLNHAAQNGAAEETGLKNGKQGGVWLFVNEKLREGKPPDQFFHRFLFHTAGFLPHAFRFLYFCTGRLNMAGKIFLRIVPQTVEKVIERPDARRVVRIKAAENGIKRCNAHGVDPGSNSGNTKGQ